MIPDIPICYFGTLKYPSDPEIKAEVRKSRIEWVDGEPKYKSGYMEFSCLRNHHGTHVDAPFHKIPSGKKINEYNFDKFVNAARLVDLTNNVILQREKRRVEKIDLEGKLDFDSPVSALVFYTGFCDEIASYEGRIKRGDLSHEAKLAFERTFPYFSEEAAEYIMAQCLKLNVVGIDSFSFDPSGSNSEVHRAFFKKDICLLEAAYNLRHLKDNLKLGCKNGLKNFVLHCVPIPLKGGDAGWTAAYAEIE